MARTMPGSGEIGRLQGPKRGQSFFVNSNVYRYGLKKKPRTVDRIDRAIQSLKLCAKVSLVGRYQHQNSVLCCVAVFTRGLFQQAKGGGYLCECDVFP